LYTKNGIIVVVQESNAIMFKSDNLKELPADFIKLQEALTPIKKDAQGNRSKYASLTNVVQGVEDAVHKNNFVLFHTMRQGGAASACMETVLLHKSGEHISSTIEVPIAKTSDPQAYGSAMTYGRRYSIMALLGLVTEDDDGQSASITLEDRLSDIFAAQTADELRGADIKHFNASGLTRTEKWAIRACVKAMAENIDKAA
jgi:hypothetical protein